MAARIGKANIKTSPAGKTKVEPAKAYTSVSRKIGAEKKAKRAVKAIETAAPGRVRVAKRGRQ